RPRQRKSFLALDRGNDFLCRGLIAGVADHDPKAARGGANRGGSADAAASAGDNRNSIRQIRPPKENPALTRRNRAIRSCPQVQPICPTQTCPLDLPSR